MKIIKATDTIPVEHPVFCLFGQPGICKTSLGYSAERPLLLDFDKGAHRAANRQDTLVIDSWSDVADLMKEARAHLESYSTITVDTVGRCLDVMTADIIENTPKYGRDGNLTQQGWGVLKGRFRTWISQLRALGKDVLLIAHLKEDKDGDVTVMRPDISGGSYGEVMKIADFVGYVHMAGRERVIDFNPTDRWVGKNPARWQPFRVPTIDKAQLFMAGLLSQGREALGAISEESAKITQMVDDWRAAIEAYADVDEFNRAIPETNKLAAVIAPQVKKLLLDAAKAKGFTFDTKAKRFTAPEPVEA